MLNLNYPIANLRGAEYNPRIISDTDLETLCQSIKQLGLVKPLIVRNDLLVAGHQRTKALLSLGVETAPVYLLSQDTTTYDEVRFNQLHNGTDLDCGDENCFIEGDLSLGYQQINPERLTGNFRGKLAGVRGEIAKLITKYGSWGGIVATQAGEVIHASQYALAAKLCGVQITTFVIKNERKNEYQNFLNKQYGVFDYSKIKRTTYVQSYAQMNRLRGDSQLKSTLYHNFVEPWLKKHPEAIGLDFGCGHGDYVKKLSSQGFDIIGVELFKRVGATDKLDITAINKMIDYLVIYLKKQRFDYVVCDSVLNSIDCEEAEKSVMTLLNLFCKPGGLVFFSGRNLERVTEEATNMTKHTQKGRSIEFLDNKGFTALYRKGHWFFQKFHDNEDCEKLITDYGFKKIDHRRNIRGTSWQVVAAKIREINLEDAIAAVSYEFNLPLSPTRRLNRHNEVIEVIKRYYD